MHSHMCGWVWGVWVSGGEEKIEECVLVLVGSHSPGFDMSDTVWLYAVGGPQVNPLTFPELHEV